MAAIAARFAPTVVNITVIGTHKFLTTGKPGDARGDAGGDAAAAPGSGDADAMRGFLRSGRRWSKRLALMVRCRTTEPECAQRAGLRRTRR
jgi:hypothetical protein